MEITPPPTDEEAAAIVAAVQIAWPGGAGAPPEPTTPRWRFAGRWWSQPIPLRRERPW